MFAEPDRNTSKPVVNRWFGRADGVPFFFAGIWREWEGDHGTTAAMARKPQKPLDMVKPARMCWRPTH